MYMQYTKNLTTRRCKILLIILRADLSGIKASVVPSDWMVLGRVLPPRWENPRLVILEPAPEGVLKPTLRIKSVPICVLLVVYYSFGAAFFSCTKKEVNREIVVDNGTI